MYANDLLRISKIITACNAFLTVMADNSGLATDEGIYAEPDNYPTVLIYEDDRTVIGIVCVGDSGDYGYFDSTTPEFTERVNGK